MPTFGMVTTASPLCLLCGELVACGICVGVLKGAEAVPGTDRGGMVNVSVLVQAPAAKTNPIASIL